MWYSRKIAAKHSKELSRVFFLGKLKQPVNCNPRNRIEDAVPPVWCMTPARKLLQKPNEKAKKLNITHAALRIKVPKDVLTNQRNKATASPKKHRSSFVQEVTRISIKTNKTLFCFCVETNFSRKG